jgi:succinate dehydrogenase flavin-adding protein (antitoxin of CptAB toxin-antitoxin module)
MELNATVTYWEKHDWKLYMTFRKLQETEKVHFKKLVEEILSISKISELSKEKGFAIIKIIKDKLNTN